MDVRQIALEIVAREGGYVTDPDDPSGVRKFGVTLPALRRLGLDVTGDGAVDAADIEALGREQAAAVLIDQFHERTRIAELPAALQPCLFDMYVASGANAVRVLQRLLNDMRIEVEVDGVIGPRTIDAAAQAQDAAPDHLADAFAIARRNYYYALADRRPESRKYARRDDGGKGGWILRAESFVSPHYRLGEAEHRARCAGWA